jgi:hypothetical protein
MGIIGNIGVIVILGILAWVLWLCILAWVLWLWLGKRMVRTNRAAILATAIPQAILAIVFVVLYLLSELAGMRGYALVWLVCFFVSFGIGFAAFLSSVVFAIRRKWEIAKGTGFGSGISWVVWMIAFWIAFALYA